MTKKIKNLILMVAIIFLLTGCTGSYTMTVDKYGIREYMSVTENEETAFIAAYQYKKNTLEGYVHSYNYLNDYVKYMQDTLVEKYYISKDTFSDDNYVLNNGIYKEKYVYSINNKKRDYDNKSSLIVNNVIKDALIVNDTNIILYVENIPEVVTSNLSSFTVAINVDGLDVTSNNADSVTDGTYTWIFTKSNYYNKSISINISKPQSEENEQNTNKTTNQQTDDSNDNNALHIMIAICIYLIIIIVVINVMNSRKKLNL